MGRTRIVLTGLGPSLAGLTGISCPTTTSCVAVGRETVVTSSDPTGGAGEWQTTPVPAVARVARSIMRRESAWMIRRPWCRDN